MRSWTVRGRRGGLTCRAALRSVSFLFLDLFFSAGGFLETTRFPASIATEFTHLTEDDCTLYEDLGDRWGRGRGGGVTL